MLFLNGQSMSHIIHEMKLMNLGRDMALSFDRLVCDGKLSFYVNEID